jgi:hypothetical protein
MVQTFDRAWRAGVTATCGALVVDLFFGWQRADVHMNGVLAAHTTSSGWNGTGAFAGACALGLTALAVFAGGAHVGVATSMMRAHVDTTLWPAWMGLGLATAVAMITVAPVLRRQDEGPQSVPAPHGPS